MFGKVGPFRNNRYSRYISTSLLQAMIILQSLCGAWRNQRLHCGQPMSSSANQIIRTWQRCSFCFASVDSAHAISSVADEVRRLFNVAIVTQHMSWDDFQKVLRWPFFFSSPFLSRAQLLFTSCWLLNPTMFSRREFHIELIFRPPSSGST